MSRSSLAAAAVGLSAVALTILACGSSTPRSRPAVAPGALRGAHTVWIADATTRTGPLASGESRDLRARPLDVREDLASAIRRAHGLELAPARDAADLVLYFEQADRLRCFRCRQPEDRWYWWGVVSDATGREIAILHGETTAGSSAAARAFVAELAALVREARRAAIEGTR